MHNQEQAGPSLISLPKAAGSAVPGCVHESLSGNPGGQMSARYRWAPAEGAEEPRLLLRSPAPCGGAAQVRSSHIPAALRQGASDCGAGPGAGICGSWVHLCPPPCWEGGGEGAVVTAAPQHSLSSCFWLPRWWLAGSRTRDPCRRPLQTAGERLLWVFRVPKALIS